MPSSRTPRRDNRASRTATVRIRRPPSAGAPVRELAAQLLSHLPPGREDRTEIGMRTVSTRQGYFDARGEHKLTG